MLFLAQQGFRVVAHDRRGHGRSSQSSSGNDMNAYADDLAAVLETLDLRNVDARGSLDRRRRSVALRRSPWNAARGQGRADRAPFRRCMVADRRESRTASPMDAFDEMRAALAADRAQFCKESRDASSTVPIGPELASRRARSISSGAVSMQARPQERHTTASRPSRRRTSRRI